MSCRTFDKLLGPLSDILNRDMVQRERQAAKATERRMTLDELNVTAVLGVGAFATIKLVTHGPSGRSSARVFTPNFCRV